MKPTRVMNKAKWHTGSGETITFEALLKQVHSHVEQAGQVYIGTDSFLTKNKCIFANAICLHGAEGQRGGKYFFRKDSVKQEKFSGLVQRLLKEVQQSIEVAMIVAENVPAAEIELHLDISPSNKQAGTSPYAGMLTGYAKGAGFDIKIKPNAWASQSVADKHSK